ITIVFTVDAEDNFVLTISDDGVGLPEDLNLEETTSIGLQLVIALTRQLDGKLVMKREQDTAGVGTTFQITFP
ncbi:MAG: sensor histidine kinase, partial [Candidatus Electrothrix sp. AR3]|nr:sensor histidine kinase [Candidatus Electrothrix sp. AR3]